MTLKQENVGVEGGVGGVGGYSRLLSPFHLQVPLCFPEPSPGALGPPCASASSAATSSRDIHLDAMLPPSNTRTGAPARSQGSEGPGAAGWLITHAAAPRNPKEQNILLLGFPRSVSPGPRLPEPRGGGSHVPSQQPASSWRGTGIIPWSVFRQPGIPSARGEEGTAGALDLRPGILILFCFSSLLLCSSSSQGWWCC